MAQPTRPEPQLAEQQALSVFDEGLDRFERGEYSSCLGQV